MNTTADRSFRYRGSSRTRTRRRLSGPLIPFLLAASALFLLCPALSGAAGAQQRRGVDDMYNGCDVVGAWGWSVGSSGAVVHWPRGAGSVQAWKLNADFDIQAIDMVTAKVGYLVTFVRFPPFAKARVYKTTDGGRHWARKQTAKVDLLTSVRFRTTKLGWVAGRSGTILKTTNGGTTWVKQKTHTSATLYSLSFTSNKLGYAVGAGGVVLKTTNAGKTWSKKTSGTTAALYGVDFVSAAVGWAVGGDSGGVCRKTTNGGKTWKAQGSALPPLAAVDFVSKTTGWVVGNEGAWPDMNANIIKVTQGGAVWTDQSATVDPAPPDYGLVALKAVDLHHAYAAGQSEASVYTDDGVVWHLGHIATR
jgi:photosystem II stability/assembly factor-like uncharacterized protein